jgi:hypothetical protein
MGAVCAMASTKQHRDNLSLLGLLRSLVGAPSTRIRLQPSKVAQPGARPAPPADTGKRGTGKEIFGQRKNCSSYR